MVFKSQKELYAFFQKYTDMFEEDYTKHRKATDVTEDQFEDLEEMLDQTLDEPTEIWHDDGSYEEFPIFYFIRAINDKDLYHVAVTYVSQDDEPTFIFLHLVTNDLELLSLYRKGDLVFDRAFEEVEFAAIEGDSLSEGDPLSLGLFIAMLKVRSEKDIPNKDYKELGELYREETIESADEIWRNQDTKGNVFVTFIKEYDDHAGINDLHYISITQEDENSNVHALLFSFPTNDLTLVDRYRHGENLQAEEVSQESSH